MFSLTWCFLLEGLDETSKNFAKSWHNQIFQNHQPLKSWNVDERERERERKVEKEKEKNKKERERKKERKRKREIEKKERERKK